MKEFYFRCIVCEKEFSKDAVEYVCPLCGQNLEVKYDYKKISKKVSIKKFKQNADNTIWRYEQFLPVNKDNTTEKIHIFNTPLIKSINLSASLGIKNLFFKDDTKLPSASLKDRASSVVVSYAIQNKKEKIVTASTGNAGCALSCVSSMVGVQPMIFVPENAPINKLVQMLVYGAEVYRVRGNYDDCYDLVLKLCSENKNFFNRSTGVNPFTREGKKTVSLEIWEQLGYKVPEIIFVPIGDGNIISGVWKGFKDLYEVGLIEKIPKLIGVQSKLSNAVYLTLKKIEQKYYSTKNKRYRVSIQEIFKNTPIEKVSATTIADSISVDIPRDGYAAIKSVIESGGFIVEVDDKDIIDAIKILSEKEGLFSEPASATAFAGLLQVNKYSSEIKDRLIVVLVTGHGLKDVKSIVSSYKHIGKLVDKRGQEIKN
jgi:threonine synthase